MDAYDYAKQQLLVGNVMPAVELYEDHADRGVKAFLQPITPEYMASVRRHFPDFQENWVRILGCPTLDQAIKNYEHADALMSISLDIERHIEIRDKLAKALELRSEMCADAPTLAREAMASIRKAGSHDKTVPHKP